MKAPPPVRPEELMPELAFTHQRTIFLASTGMVGVCLTAIGLILVVEKLSSVRTLSRVMLAIDAFVFLLSAFLSFLAMRSRVRGRRTRLDVAADAAILAGLVGAVLVCSTLVFTLL